MRLSGLGKRVLCAVVGAGLLAAVGCGGAGSSGNNSGGDNIGGNTGTPEAGQNLYFSYQTSGNPPYNTIKSVPVSANGSVTPTAYFDTRGIHESVDRVVMDSAGNFYATAIDVPQTAGGPLTYQIVEYAATATGSPMPIRTIPGSVTGLTYSKPLAVDSAGNIAVISGDLLANPQIPTSIRVFAPAKNDGPSQVISGPATGLLLSTAPTFDAAGNLYVTQAVPSSSLSNSYQLSEFAAGATGNVAPIRTLQLGNVGSAPQFDGAGNMYFYSQVSVIGGEVVVYAPDAKGTDAPIRTITLPIDQTGSMEYNYTNELIQVSAAGDIYMPAYNVPTAGGTVVKMILHFAPGATGAVAAPVTTITSSQFNDGSFQPYITLH